MSLRVIGDLVATAQDVVNEVRVLRRPVADEEEDGLETVAVEDVENGGCVLGMRAVIDGEKRRFAAGGLAFHQRAEKRAARHQRADDDDHERDAEDHRRPRPMPEAR